MILAFLCAAVAILLLVLERYLLPAARAAKGMDPKGRKQLAALSILVLTIVLVMLLVALILAIRPGRFFLPRRGEPRTRTSYIDAWEEAGKRMQTPQEDSQDESGGPGG